MDTVAEKIIKIILFVLVVIAALLFFVMLNRKRSEKFSIDERVYAATHLAGIICGAAGLVAAFIWPLQIIELHIWELIILPFAFMEMYWLLVIRKHKVARGIDEKQMFDLHRAAALAWSVSFPLTIVLFVLYQNSILSGLFWFPILIFASLAAYCGGALYYFRRQ